jgi:hypothetical protein
MRVPLVVLLAAGWPAIWAQDTPAGKFDVAGIRLGMGFKEAMTALHDHNPNLKVVPDSFQYPGLPYALTYGINAVGGGEGFYFLLTMPPNEVTISKITRVIHYAQDSMPRQDVVAANLAKQYGQVSYDTLPASLTLGWREMFWIDDEQGNRLKGEPIRRCLGQSTFYMNGLARGSRNQWDPVNVRLPPLYAKLRIEEGFTNRGDPIAGQCAKFSIVGARLFRARVMGVAVPNLVEYVVVMAASGPMDRSATNATHEYWRKNAKGGGPKGKSAPGSTP